MLSVRGIWATAGAHVRPQCALDGLGKSMRCAGDTSKVALETVVTFAVLITRSALADVRHPRIPDALLGNWAPASESCPGAAETRLVLAAQSYADTRATCEVMWVEERAARSGVVYSIHMRCKTPPAEGARESTTIVWLKQDGSAAIGASFDALTNYRLCR